MMRMMVMMVYRDYKMAMVYDDNGDCDGDDYE
jgi:hypothetical protein